MKLYPLLLSIVLVFTCAQTLTDIVVTTGQDNPSGTIIGEVTLRDAIDTINSGSGGEIIAFAPNVSTIQLLAPLPAITEQVTIDGLAHVVGTAIQPGDCNSITSPIDNLDLFIALLGVTIDGSTIPNSNTGTQTGLFFEASSNNSIVRGIRIQNISGTPDSPSACGICAENIEQDIVVECCMVDTVFCRNNPLIPSTAIGLGNILTISKCYVRNIKSAPINFALTDNIAETGSAFGILNPLSVIDTRVECVESGSILGKLETSLDEPNLGISRATGIFNYEPFSMSKLKSKGCFFGSGSTDEKIIIKNCHISYIKGGSILFTVPAEVTLDPVAGIYLETSSEILVEDCFVCDIHMGSSTLSNESNVGNEIDTQLTTEGLFGIFARSYVSSVCIQQNTVQAIVHGSVEINIKESFTSLSTPIGIFAQAIPLVIENNSVSSIFGGYHTTAGECSTIETLSISILGQLLGTTGIVATQVSNNLIQTTKAGSACPTPENGSDPLIITCNNTVTSVSGETLIAAGEGSTIQSSGSAGIAGSSSEKIIANNNAVTNIFGSNLSTLAPSSNSKLLFGTKGIVSVADEAELCDNTISTIQEGKITSSFKSIHYSSESEEFPFFSPPQIIQFFGSPAHTTGITHLLLHKTSKATITNNMIDTIIGSQPSGPGATMPSVGVGILTSLEEDAFKQNKKNAPITKQCGSYRIESIIADNTITTVISHITRPAYGIFSDQLSNTQSLTIETNTIQNINGGAAALPQTITGNVNTIVTEVFCQPGTTSFNELTLVPSIKPYEPSSGIYILDSNCSTVQNNTIQKVCAPTSQARGITSTASQDVEIFENSISKIKGPGIFIGGAPIPVGSAIPTELEPVSASVRNVIHSNKTFDNAAKGIELGVSNWSNLFEFASFFDLEDIETTTVVGNHDQAAPEILRVVCNSNETITIEVRLIDPNHPNSDFIIQFFVNSTNTIPHGETPISEFDGSEFIMTTFPSGTGSETDIVGIAQKTFTFMPLAEVKNGDNITAHVTLLTDGSEDSGDTSEFGVEIKNGPGFSLLNRPKPSSFCFNKILSRP